MIPAGNFSFSLIHFKSIHQPQRSYYPTNTQYFEHKKKKIKSMLLKCQPADSLIELRFSILKNSISSKGVLVGYFSWEDAVTCLEIPLNSNRLQTNCSLFLRLCISASGFTLSVYNPLCIL